MNHAKRHNHFILLAVVLVICLAIVIMTAVFADPTATASAEEGGTPPTIIRTGGNDVKPGAFTAGFPYAIVGQPYKAPDGSNYKVEATGTQPITFETRYGSEYAPMPPGLTLDPNTGEITGTPTVAGVYQKISIAANNAYGRHNVMALMYVYDDTYKPTINSPAAGALPTGYVNSAYSQYIYVTSNTAEKSTVTVTSGSLPGGLSIQSAEAGHFKITGTPTTKGTVTFTLRAENPVGFDEKEYTIEVKDEIIRPTITKKPEGVYAPNGAYFEFQCEATGTNTAENPILFFVYENSSTEKTPNAKGEYDLGNGLSLTKDGKIYGTPTSSEQVSFTIGAKNKNKDGRYTNTSWGSGYCYIIIRENGAVISITISPESTSVPKGGKRQFTAEVERVGDLVMPLTWQVWNGTSDDTTIDENGLLTVGLDETAETLTVLADSHDGQRASVTVAVVDHMHRTALVPAKDKTCTQDGNIAHFRCSECGGLFEDASAVNVLTEEDVVIPAGHEYGELVAKKEPTCSAAGMQAHYKCSVCNQYFDEHKAETTAEALTIDIDPDAHAFGEWTEEVPADCTHTGTKAHKDCTLCGKHFDEGGAEIADLTIATNDKHDWGAPKYVWPNDSECKAERVCKHNGSHKETETVTATESVVTEATCEQKGKIKYTATFENAAFATQSHEVETDYAPHTFGEWIEEVAPTTESNGIMAHKDCTVCGKHFDENGEEIADLTIPKIGTYRVTVVGGTGGGIIAEGASVTITADEITGREFVRWEITGLDTSGLVLTNAELTFTMPASDVTATALYRYIDYKATVVGGTAQVDADAEPTSEVFATYECPVSIFATAPAGKRFVRWTSDDGVVFANATSAETTFTMPAKPVTVTAVFENIDYTVTVTDGTADKTTAHYGDTVSITAGEAAEGKVFDKWTCETDGITIEFASATSASTTFTMPAGDITVKANYRNVEEAPSFEVKVNGGTGARGRKRHGNRERARRGQDFQGLAGRGRQHRQHRKSLHLYRKR